MRIITLVISLWTLTGFAQHGNVDSLLGVWNDPISHDTVRLQALNDAIWKGYLFTQPDSAFLLADKAYQFAKEKKYARYLSDALNIKGISHAVRGNYPQAIQFFEQNLDFAIENNNLDLQAKMANNIAIIYRDQAKFADADKYLLKALAVFEDQNNNEYIAKTCNNLGISSMRQGNYSKGYEYIQRALRIHLETGDTAELAGVYNNMGNVFQKHGDYQKAITFFQKSLELAKGNNLLKEQSTALNNMGLMYSYESKYEKALELYSASLKIRNEIQDLQGQSSVYSKMGNCYMYMGDYSKGIEFAEKSLEIEEQLGEMGGVALYTANIGWAYYKVADSLKTIDRDSSLNAFKLAYQLNLKSAEEANKLGADDAIRNSYKNLYNIAYDLDSLSKAYGYLDLLIKRRDLNLKYNFFSLSEREKEIYFTTMAEDYEKLFEFALLHQDSFPSAIDQAFNYVLKNKAITLKSSTAMRQKILTSEDSSLIDQYHQWLELRKQLLKFHESLSQLDSLEEITRNAEKELAKESEEFKHFEALDNLQWQDVQFYLNKSEAAVEFIHFNNVKTKKDGGIYAALIITKDWERPKYIMLCNGSELASIFKKTGGNNLEMINKLYGKKNALNTELYKLIWEPLEKHLKGIKTIYYSPSGLLHKISFSALAKNQSTYLSDNIELHQLGSISQLASTVSIEANPDQTVYLVGGISYNSDTTLHEVWSYLPNTLTETLLIYKHLFNNGYLVKRFTGSEANESLIKEISNNASILHISTHGYFFPDPKKIHQETNENTIYQDDVFFRGIDDKTVSDQSTSVYAQWNFVENENPLMRSGILLAGANDVWQKSALDFGEDGVLTAAEVATLDMHNTSLVVLSACETGLGDIKGSEGVYGLQRSFKMAGVQNLIISLWQVPDKETAEFMITFYQHLVKHQNIQKAFSKTQKEMRKKYAPFYWAAFVLVE